MHVNFEWIHITFCIATLRKIRFEGHFYDFDTGVSFLFNLNWKIIPDLIIPSLSLAIQAAKIDSISVTYTKFQVFRKINK